jgi:hypothetical protein
MKKNKGKKELPPIGDKYFNINKLEETENNLHEKGQYVKTLIQKLTESDLELKAKDIEIV